MCVCVCVWCLSDCGVQVYKLLDEEFLKQMKEDGGAAEEGKPPTQQQLDSQKVIIFSHMNKVFRCVLPLCVSCVGACDACGCLLSRVACSLHSHPLGKLVIDFTDEFLRHKDRILSARPSTALAKITQEIQTFLGTPFCSEALKGSASTQAAVHSRPATTHPDRLIITVEHYYGGEVAHVEQFVHTARLAAEHCVFSLLYDIVYPVYTKRVRTMPVLVYTLSMY